MKKVKLTQGKQTFIDDADLKFVNQWSWYYHSAGYAARKDKDPLTGKWNTVLLHRAITDCPKGLVIDHINHNRLDNRRVNLRIVTAKQNSRNSKKQKGTTSKYKGIYWFKRVSKWMARIRVDYKWIQIGYFTDENEAAKAYNLAAIKYFGEFANLNIIEEK